MTFDPLNTVSEILGTPADQMRNPVNAGYECPFLADTCKKSSKLLSEPYPVCSVFRGARRGVRSDRPPVCTCPNRLYEIDLKADILREAWVGPQPINPVIAHEVNMQKFGRVDFVLADYDEASDTIRSFLPVEMQAVDNTGSVLNAYSAIVSGQLLPSKPAYGFNWGNVRKRFISQLIAKGYFCHHWQTRIVAVLQVDLFEEFQKHARVSTVPKEDANIIFMLYQYGWNGADARWELKLDRVVPTTHMQVMQAILYETPPLRAKFEERILERIHRGGALAGVSVIETVGEVAPEPDDDQVE